MTRICSLLLAGAVLMGCATTSLAIEGNYAFINLDKVFNEYEKSKSAQEKLDVQADEFNAEFKKMLDKYKVLNEEFEKLRDEAENVALSEESRAKGKEAAEAKLVERNEYRAELRSYDETRRKQLRDQLQRMREGIVEEIVEQVKDYAAKQGFLAVMDYSGKSLFNVPVVLYSDPRVDITQEVIDLLNAAE